MVPFTRSSLLSLWRYLALFLLFASSSVFAAQPTAFDHWAKKAKLGGAAIAVGMSETELNQMLDDLVAQHVTVVEADSDMSNYQSDAQFELELALMKQFADAAHKRGLRVVWYIPSLEVITLNGKNIPNTMAKDHPDWVQVGLDGQDNVFYGGGGQVFWVETDAESAWMSPSSTGYRNYFFNRIKKMVATGIDGIWADVPIYADFGNTKWSDFNPEAVAKFEADTGFSRPVAEDWDDPAWKRWIHWRHEELARFLKDLTLAARSVNSEVAIFAETLPTDYNGGTIYGLDASFIKEVEGLTEVWEIDTMSNNVGMRKARTDDWISFISALKYARGATGDKPSWTFSYGKQADDAQQVMAQAMIAGNNPYELQVPEMATTVSPAFRSRMFNWSKVNASYLFESQSTAKTGILYSSASRDYVDQFKGLGMFATTDAGNDELWWAAGSIDSVYQRDYLAEHRGVLKALVSEHIPFNILVVPDQEELNRYQTVLMPNIEAISDTEANRLRQYVQQGGQLIITGPNPTGMDQYGMPRSNYALADLLGFNLSDPLPTANSHSFGSGETHYFAARLGKQYLSENNSTARDTLITRVKSGTSLPVSINADERVYLETSRLGQQALLQFTNFIGLNGSFSIAPTTVSVNYTIPAGEQVTQVSITHPDTTNTAQSPLSFTQSGNQISFDVPLTQYALVIISFEGAQTPVTNHMPVAGEDQLQTEINSPLAISHTQLLVNDGDLDGDSITISDVFASENTRGSVTDLGAGNYRYTPATNFNGIDTVSYTLLDSNGAQTTGIISITVAPFPSFYYPTSVTLSLGTEDGTDLSLFTTVDDQTYDIKSVSNSGKQVLDWYATTTIGENPADIQQINIRHNGHYSLNNITQQAYLYNYQTSSWDLFDSAVVGSDSNYPAVTRLSDNLSTYLSASKELRVRIRAERSMGAFDGWHDQLVWEVIPVMNIANNAPTANAQSLTVPSNQTTIITLSGSDPEAQTLSYRIITPPTHGQLTGTAPNLQYQPTTNFSGTDSFSFVANDGALDSTSATISITVQQAHTGNSVSHAIVNGSLTLDGDIADWSAIPSLGRDNHSPSHPDAQVDFLEAWVAHDENNLYLAYLNNGDINTQTWWPWQAYLDTDNNASTGYQVQGKIGAEYMLQGASLYRYSGTGSNWAWTYLGSMSHAVNGAVAEFEIPRNLLENPNDLRLIFMGRNGIFSGDYSQASIDTYPNTYALVPLHYDLLLAQPSVIGEPSGILSMTVSSAAASGETTLSVDASYPLQAQQMVTYLASDGHYYALPIAQINGQTITLAKPLPAPIAAGQTLWNFYKNPTHPNLYGYRAIADFAIRKLSHENLNRGRHVLFGDSWLQQDGVAQRLGERLPAAEMINQAMGGNTSEDLLARFDQTILPLAPDYVWILSGVNDYFGGISAAQYRNNLQSIIAKVNASGARAIVIDSPVAQLMPEGDALQQLSHQYATSLANSQSIHYQLGTSNSNIVTTPVSHPQSIIVDGQFSDWSGIPSFGMDGNDISINNAEADFLEAWIAHDDDMLYVAYRNEGAINTTTRWPWQLFIDANNNSNTGYQAGNNVNANYMLQGASLYRYTGTGSDWSWEYISGASGVINNDFGEFKIPRSALGNPSKIHAQFVGRNGIFTGDYSEAARDSYPNLGLGHLTYLMDSTPSNTVSATSLSLDGTLDDWATLQSFGNDGDDISVAGAQADWLETWMAHDSSHFYLAYENDGPINTTTWWPWQIYLDTDNNPATGYQVGLGIGAEYLVEGASIQQYTGTGSNWAWNYVGGAEHAVSQNTAELKFARTLLGSPQNLRIAFRASNAAFTGSYASDGIDLFPSAIDSSTDAYLRYYAP